LNHADLSRYRRQFLREDSIRAAVWLLASLATTVAVLLLLARFSPWSIGVPLLLVAAGIHLLIWLLATLRSAILLKRPRLTAARIESLHPHLALKVRSVLDFQTGHSDVPHSLLMDLYQEQVQRLLAETPFVRANLKRPLRAILPAGLLCLSAFLAFRDHLGLLKNNAGVLFGSTLLVLDSGTLTLYEPEYTQIPGRTLPLQPGHYQMYPGSRVQITLPSQAGLQRLFMARSDAPDPVELTRSADGSFHQEFVFLSDLSFEFLVSRDASSGRSQSFLFQAKLDAPPTIELKRFTEEGPVNLHDPLELDAELRDDFSLAQLEVIAQWDGGEKRMKLPLPGTPTPRFLTRNRWNISDLVPEEVIAFTLSLEAKDNNPITGPGVSTSKVLHYELESPDRQHDEFMRLARELLDRLTHTLADNLDSPLATAAEQASLSQALFLAEQIQSGLMQAQGLTGTLQALLRQNPYLTQIDQDFLTSFRNQLTQAYRFRMETSQLYASVMRPQGNPTAFRSLQQKHGHEETRLEELTYELLLQLKLWALLEMERSKNNLEQALDSLENMLDQENPQEQELREQVSKMLQQIMKEFNSMLAKAAQEMDRDMEEFMNAEAMESQQQMMEDLIQQIMEALKAGDMEKAKALMEEFRSQMQTAMQQMQAAMGRISPEMQAMMESMREMNGLLEELKNQEEELESATQDLRKKADQQLGGNNGLSPKQREEQKRLLAELRRLLSELNQRLAVHQTHEEDVEMQQKIQELKRQAEEGSFSHRQQLEAQIRQLENAMDVQGQEQLRQLQEIALRSLDTTDSMQEYLDQGELMPGLETGFKLEKHLLDGENHSRQLGNPQVVQQAKPLASFQAAQEELYRILDMLQNLKESMEQRRKDHLQKQQSQQHAQLQQRQEEIRRMIEEFRQEHGEKLAGSPLMQKMEDIERSMRNAGSRLGDARMDSGIQYEQDALRQIGEMLEQMQQSQQGQGNPMLMGMGFGQGRQESFQGPMTGEVAIPESQYQARRQELREVVRKQMERDLPEQFGKEIKQYYERLIDP
jgi:hypothetical protein